MHVAETETEIRVDVAFRIFSSFFLENAGKEPCGDHKFIIFMLCS